MTGPRLYAARYNTARTTMQHDPPFENPARIGVRCNLPGWLQRLEVTIKAKSRVDAYERYRTHQGDAVALLDNYADKPIVGGWIYEVVPDNRHVHYICAGPWKRHTDEYETDNPSGPTQGSVTYLSSTVLPDHVPAIEVINDSDHFDATSTDAGGFRVNKHTGTTPQDILTKWLLRIGSSNDEIMDYWLEERKLDGVGLQKPVPFFKARSETANVDWQVQRRDLVSQQFSRHIWDLVNDVTVWFEWHTFLNGAQSAGATSIDVDSSTNFGPGQEIEIELDSERVHRTHVTGTVVSPPSIGINDALPHSAPDDGLVLKVKPQDTANVTDTDSVKDFWTREHREIVTDIRGYSSDQTQINQYRNTIRDTLAEAVQQASFRIGSRWIRDGNGARWPLWRMLHRPGYIRINDLFPAAALFDLSIDNLRSFFTIALDYDHDSRVMTVTPDAFLGDDRLDVLLQRAGFGIGQIVDRSPAQAGPQT